MRSTIISPAPAPGVQRWAAPLSRGIQPKEGGVTPVSLRCRSSVTPVTLRCHSGVTPVSLRCHSGVTPATLRCHSSVTPVTFRCHSGVTPVTLRCHSGDTHFSVTSLLLLRAHSPMLIVFRRGEETWREAGRA